MTTEGPLPDDARVRCECENHKHFEHGTGHTYGTAPATHAVWLDGMGKWVICFDCIKCMGPLMIVELRPLSDEEAADVSR